MPREDDDDKEEEEEGDGGGDEDLGAFFEEVERAEKEVGRKNDDDDDDDGNNDSSDDDDSRREETFVDDDGTTYDWDEEDRKYKPRGRGGEENAPAGSGRRDARGGGADDDDDDDDDDDEGFDVSQMTFCPEEETLPVTRDVEKTNGFNENEKKKKRKKPEIDIEAMRRKREQQQKNKNRRKKTNASTNKTKNQTTSVYCENLPHDATIERVENFFSKCGQIKQDPATLMPKIKLYKEEGSNEFSGNALVTYLLRPSVELALTVLDGTKFELVGEEVKVTEADFSKSKSAAGGDGGEENSDDAKKKADKYAHVPKEEIRKNAALLKRKAERQLGWDGFDDEHDPTKTMVVLRNIYDEIDLEEARKDGLNAQTFSDELKEDVAEECQAKCGKVENSYVTANGIVTVRFKEPESADTCLHLMHNRWFGGKQIKAELWNGIEKFIGLKNIEKKETEEEEKRRLDAYAASLGQDSDSD